MHSHLILKTILSEKWTYSYSIGEVMSQGHIGHGICKNIQKWWRWEFEARLVLYQSPFSLIYCTLISLIRLLYIHFTIPINISVTQKRESDFDIFSIPILFYHQY